MKAFHRTLSYLCWVVVGPSLHAANLPELNRDMTYREVKTWHEKFLADSPSRMARLDAMRAVITSSRFGQRGLDNIYGNFEGSRAIDPSIPGVEKTALLQRSASNSQAKGYRRELLYAIEFHNDPRFSLEEMNRILKRPWGNTDADLVIRHSATGLYGRIEVKDVSLASQAANLDKYKEQIAKMSREARLTGQPQVWANRREVHPALLAYARENRVVALGEVRTGRSLAGSEMPIGDAKGVVDQTMTRTRRGRDVAGGAGLAFGTWMLLNSAPGAATALQAVLKSETRSAEAWRSLGEHGSNAAAGGGMVLSSGALMASRFVNESTQTRLFYLSRAGGVASVMGMVAGEAFLIARYVHGDVTSRDLWTTQWVIAASGGGAFTGAWAGRALGSMGGPVTADAAAFLGSVAGGWLGGHVGTRTADSYYEWKFGELDKAFGRFVYDRYGVK